MPAKSAKSVPDYQALNSELDAILVQLQQPDVSVDDAVKLYEQGLKVVEQLEQYVSKAENKLEKLRLQTQTNDEV